MPNGGGADCADCVHFAAEIGSCSLRGLKIEDPRWTTCRNFKDGHPRTDSAPNTVTGPLYAIVCEIKAKRGSYSRIPYFDGTRPTVTNRAWGADTFVNVTGEDGRSFDFRTADEYLDFYRSSGRGG